MTNCAHGRDPSRCTECALRAELDQQYAINSLLKKELGVYEESHRHWKDLVMYAYQRSSDALMTPANKPREFRAKRDQALCDINKKLGGAIR